MYASPVTITTSTSVQPCSLTSFQLIGKGRRAAMGGSGPIGGSWLT
jgi:hypothetical protein